MAAHQDTLAAHPDLDRALSLCFDAVVAQEDWPAAMEALAASMNALGCCFHRQGVGKARLALPASSRYRDMLTDFYKDGWMELDLRSQRGWAMVKAGAPIALEDQLSTEEERSRSPLYQDLFARHELSYFGGACLQQNDQLWAINFVRSERMGAFHGPEVDRLLLARSYFARLLPFATHMANAGASSALETLTHLGTPAMLLDWRGMVVRTNPAAEQLIDTEFSVRAGRIAAADASSNSRLQALIGDTVRREATAAGSTLGPVRIQRNERRPLIVDAIPLRSKLADGFGIAGTLLMITDLAARPTPSKEVLRRSFNLTPREADVAAHIASGATAEEIAEALRLQASSVRQVLKSLLAKTDTHRQSELVALLSRFASAQPN